MTRLKLGMTIGIDKFDDGLADVKRLGFPTAQMGCGDGTNLTESRARELAGKARNAGIEITSVWPGYSGKMRWAYSREAPPSVGLVPPETRAERLGYFKRASDFARWMGVKYIAQHVGYIPEDPSDPLYGGFLDCLRELADHCWANDEQWFCFETGQETPIALLRTIQDVGRPNLGVNYDTANHILYGKANPVDALDMLGQYVKGVHAKDGLYPTDGYKLGKEKPLGEGKVDFPAFFRRLHELGYAGAITLECELKGDRDQAIQKAKTLLEKYA
ncbi:MAG: sugar phosphate isomerase/epimerase family protein [Kiritimatiellota bacterium]|nr:sugar phosphate isomerase/epimerase family protein [Kiritimatiellota bacterium]